VQSGLSDTDAETAAAHLELIRAATPARRLALALSLSQSVISLTRHALSRHAPDMSYGADLADRVRAALARGVS
jgi:hypothetical protein